MYSDTINLKTTQFGTIISTNREFEETSIENFVKQIETKIDKFKLRGSYNNIPRKEYDAEVEKRGDDYYIILSEHNYSLEINMKNLFWFGIYDHVKSKRYSLTLNPEYSYYPVIKEKMDELAEKSNEHSQEEKIIYSFIKQNEEDCNDLRNLDLSLKRLNINKKNLLVEKIVYLTRAVAPIGGFGLFNLLGGLESFGAVLFAVSYLVLEIIDRKEKKDVFLIKRLKNSFKNSKVNNRKIKIIEDKLKYSDSINLLPEVNLKLEPSKQKKEEEASKDSIIQRLDKLDIDEMQDDEKLYLLNEMKKLLDRVAPLVDNGIDQTMQKEDRLDEIENGSQPINNNKKLAYNRKFFYPKHKKKSRNN